MCCQYANKIHVQIDIHHINHIKDNLLVVGYRDLNRDQEPSLGFAKVNFAKSGPTPLVDIGEKVCDCEFPEMYNAHKFFTSYIDCW